MASIDSNRGAKRAREAREALAADPAAPLPCLLTVVEGPAGLPVLVTTLPDHVAGACFRTGEGAVLWVNGSRSHGRPRQRFTLAHELGHAWCRHDGHLEIDTFETLNGKTTNHYEVQANAFAAEFLVPRDAMDELIEGEPTLEEVVVISAYYGVSAIMVVYRLKQLRMASDRRIEQLEGEIDDRLHLDVSRALGLKPLADRLGAIDHLPYLSPALDGTHLSAALRGDAAVDSGVAGAIDRLLT
jgi:Zn-dependent peptidase ImmA (M78 family)